MPVIALSQSREPWSSGRITARCFPICVSPEPSSRDADVVMFIYRDDYYNHDSDMKGISEIIIAKQRNGPIGTVNLVWLPQYTKFANMEK